MPSATIAWNFSATTVVPEPHVDLERHASLPEADRAGDPHALVLLVLLDPVGRHRGRVEVEAVFRTGDRTDGPHDVGQPPDRTLPGPEEVHVPGRPVRFGRPELEEHRPLENEPVRVRGDAQPVQEPLDRVPGEDELELVPALPRELGQAGADRRRDVLGFLLAHVIVASRYGRMTFAIRRPLAAR
jgi:hypothetical protein